MSNVPLGHLAEPNDDAKVGDGNERLQVVGDHRCFLSNQPCYRGASFSRRYFTPERFLKKLTLSCWPLFFTAEERPPQVVIEELTGAKVVAVEVVHHQGAVQRKEQVKGRGKVEVVHGVKGGQAAFQGQCPGKAKVEQVQSNQVEQRCQEKPEQKDQLQVSVSTCGKTSLRGKVKVSPVHGQWLEWRGSKQSHFENGWGKVENHLWKCLKNKKQKATAAANVYRLLLSAEIWHLKLI